MKNYAYCAFEDRENYGLNYGNRESQRLPFLVNCAGVYGTDVPFFTDNPGGRKDYYLLFVTAGELTLFHPDNRYTLKPGTAVVFPPGYHYRYRGATDAPTEYYWVHFTGAFVQDLLMQAGLCPLPIVLETGQTRQGKMLFGKLFDAFYPHNRMFEHRLGSVLYEILAFFGKAADLLAQSEGNLLSTSIRYINRSFEKQLPVPMLAAMENLSVSRYNTLFRKITGTSPVHYLLTLRMNSACNLLHGTDLSVREIAALVGYDDARFFSKMFKKTVGKTPGEYRATFGENDEKH